MTERGPHPSDEFEPYSRDDLRIFKAVEAWQESETEEPISDTHARMIASQWHSPGDEALASFASTGRIEKAGLVVDLIRCLREVDPGDDLANSALEALTDYIMRSDERDAVEGWNEATSW